MAARPSGFQEAHFTAAPPAAAAPSRDVALTAALLRLVTRTSDQTALAEAAVARFGSFASLLAATPEELAAMPGFGIHTVAGAKLIHEAALRLARSAVQARPPLDNPRALIAYLTVAIAREKVEQFRILFLDDNGQLIADEAQARGTVNHTPVYPREVARRALELRASAVVLVHNHPSGDPKPSDADRDMTEQVRAALGIFGITVADHIIVGNGAHSSFRALGWLDEPAG